LLSPHNFARRPNGSGSGWKWKWKWMDLELEVEVEVEADGSGSGSGSEYVYVGFDYLNFHLFVECGCVDYGNNCFGLLIFLCCEFHLYDCLGL